MRIFGAAAVCLALGGAAEAGTLYGVADYVVDANLGNNVLVEIDTDTKSSRIVGDLYEGRQDAQAAAGIANRRGELIGLMSDENGEASLAKIDPLTGRATHWRSLDPDANGTMLTDLAYHRASNRFWTVSGSQLVRINPNNGRLREMATLDASISSITFNSGRLFGSDGSAVYQINRKTGATSEFANPEYWALGPIAFSGGTLFSNAGGVLVSMIDGAARGEGIVLPASSMASLNRPSALAAESRAPAPVPIPAAGGLLMLGAAVLAWVARRRRTC